jgi:hypothetical protein
VSYSPHRWLRSPTSELGGGRAVSTASQLRHQPARGAEVKQFVAQIDRMNKLLALEQAVDLNQLEALYQSW